MIEGSYLRALSFSVYFTIPLLLSIMCRLLADLPVVFVFPEKVSLQFAQVWKKRLLLFVLATEPALNVEQLQLSFLFALKTFFSSVQKKKVFFLVVLVVARGFNLRSDFK